LAVEMPHIQFTLLEANARKCAFLQHVAGTLGLANVAVAPGRAEELGHQPALREQFDRAISRAAARPEVLLELALPFVRTGGDLVAQVSPLDPLVLEPAARLLRGGLPAGWAADVSLQVQRRGGPASTLRLGDHRSARLADIVPGFPPDAKDGDDRHTAGRVGSAVPGVGQRAAGREGARWSELID